MTMRQLRCTYTLLVAFSAAASIVAQAAGAEDYEFFEKRIRPLLVENCYKCHSAPSRKLGGNLRLDTRNGIRRGGDSGSALIPGKPDQSLLLQAVRYGDDSLQMPPRGKLSAEAIADLERWIAAGAPDPREEDVAAQTATAAPTWEETLRERRQWWSLQPVNRPPLPARPSNMSGDHPIDRFLTTVQQEKSLASALPADPRTLIRRLSLVLTGLPPKPEDVEAFVRKIESHHSVTDLKQRAQLDRQTYADLVERYLTSPHFGERWARHWMDVVRFTETHGNEWNYEVHHAWRYRDYLIRAFNADVPYDQFVREHIAGDLLPQPRLNATAGFNESVIGTAFYRFGEVNHDDCIGLRQIGYDLLDNQLDTLTKAFQATTVACARCHDHKIDAISTRDYYALLGILHSSRLVSHTIDEPAVNAATIARLQALKPKIRAAIAAAWLRDANAIAATMQAAISQPVTGGDAKSSDGQRDRADPKTARLKAWSKATAAESATPEDPFELWRTLVKQCSDGKQPVPSVWQTYAAAQNKTLQERAESDRAADVWADFRTPSNHDWEVRGHGLRTAPTSSGEFVIAPEGDALIASILPAGLFTHVVSERLNGTLRSPLVPDRGKFVSFQVVGKGSSAVRLVSNQCQLNFKNYRALTSDEPTWVTFPIPEDRASLRNYVELMTMLDNPKFPDQLSALGGDKANYRMPWQQAAGNMRSYFGVTHVVLHDDPNPPPPRLEHLHRLFADDAPQSLDEAAQRYAVVIRQALQAWADGACTDDDVRWLATLLKHGLLSNTTQELPQLAKLVEEYRRTEAALATPQVVPGVGDFGPGADQAVFVRGDWQRPAAVVPRGYLEVLAADTIVNGPGSGRRELAEQIASPGNPLTARVMANRIWQHVFGTGLVRTVDDFGRVGELPSHPELLDYLAAHFVEEGWSTKKLIRLLVTSHAFRAAAQPSSQALQIDPDNRLLSHYPARRMEAEAIRDAILTASSRLDPQLYGESVQPFREQANADRRLFPGPLDGDGRRSIYVKFNLMEAPKFLGAFNLPGGKVVQGRRDATQVPAQALALLNDPFVLQQASVWAERLCQGLPQSIAERATSMFRTAYGRPPSPAELARFTLTVTNLAQLHGIPEGRLLTSPIVWRDAAHALFVTEEFIYIP